MNKKWVLCANLIPLCIGGAAAAWTELAIWIEMKEGLIAFLGFLAASLVQIMLITANFLQSDHLLLDDARRLTESLKKQQYYWVGLLATTIWTLIFLIVCAVLVHKIQDINIFLWHRYLISLSAILTFILVSSLFFVFIKMLGLFRGVLSLHDLRTEIILKNAQERTNHYPAMASKFPQRLDVPEGYGEVVKPPETL